MKRFTVNGVARAVQRRAPRRANRPGTHDVAIHELVSPLRYDVLVRARLFDCLSRHPDLNAPDLALLTHETEVTAYRRWFELVAVPRFRPELVASPAALHSAFEERLRGAARLLVSFRSRGFDPQYPIILRVAGDRTTYPAGKPVHRARYVSDGCHRLALMLSAGWESVPAYLHRVDPAPLAAVPDNTALLLDALEVDDADYAAFLSLGYSSSTHTRLSSLVDDVGAHRPERLDELHAVIRADGRQAAVAG